MKHFLLFYRYHSDYPTKREAFRVEHLKLARAASAEGNLLLGGALVDPVDTGVLLFSAQTADVVHRFALADPYVINGLVESWQVREWHTVAGQNAAFPMD
ncbi:YciI-like protein [Asticcacaulis sp. DXS10W]|uniref:YciI-like protein n=1 Tax=Asticcacaulis currens TaxID=2984210 RepID=A0ABT5IDM3_9CAUL|nr:YciI-like protein [Asticcacaulis currens]